MKAILVALIAIIGMPVALADLGEEVSGGGQILNDSYKISFGVYALDGDPAGELQVNFHNVGDDFFDKTKFHGEKVVATSFVAGDGVTCNAAMNLVVQGTWEGMPASVVFRAGDYDAPGHWNPDANQFDTVRIQLFDYLITSPLTSGHIYDTYAGDFPAESSCVGKARTKLDRGNITIEKG